VRELEVLATSIDSLGPILELDQLGVDAPAIFGEAAGYAGPGVAATFRAFGERETSLGAFGWRRVETAHGVRFHL
jgi:hypothetical protein